MGQILLKIDDFLIQKQQKLDNFLNKNASSAGVSGDRLLYARSGYIRISKKVYRILERLRRITGYNSYSQVIEWLLRVYEEYKAEAVALRCAAEEVLTPEQYAEFDAKFDKYYDWLTSEFDDP